MSPTPHEDSEEPAPAPSISRLPDAKLIDACLAGDATAWDALTARYESLIFTMAIRMGLSHADSDDVFQNVCVLLLDHLADLRNMDRLSVWLITTTRREVWRIRRLRRMSLMSELENQVWDVENAQTVVGDDPLLPEAAAIALEEQRMVQQGISLLSDRCRTLLSLLYHEDPPLTYTEAAQRLSMAVGAVGPARARCLLRLKKILEKFGF